MANWQQSYMFSSTAQILEVYLEPSPVGSENGSAGIRWTPKNEMLQREKLAGTQLNTNPTSYPFTQSSATTPSIPSTNSSPASSPASSHTTYSSDSSSRKRSVSSEIRRRRLPEGAEPRAKNLTLTKSNGATKLAPPPPIVDAALTGSSSNYSRSPSMDSPIHVAPALPAKAAARALQRKPVNHQQILSDRELQLSPSTLPEVDILGLPRNMPSGRVPEPKPEPSNTINVRNHGYLPRSASLKAPEPSTVARRPVPKHSKTFSTASSNKDLPPDPPIDRSLLPQSKYSKSSSASTSTTGKNSTKDSMHSRVQSDPATQQPPKAAPIGLPAGPKAVVSRRPVNNKETVAVQPSESSQKVPVRGGPKLGSISSGPKPVPMNPIVTPASSLTSATVSGPVPLPDFQVHSRSNSEVNTSSLRTRSREGSQARTGSDEMITIAMDVRPSRPHRPTLSQTSSRSEPLISRSTTPLSQRSNSTAPTSISSLPNVPEVRTPLIAPEIKPSHFGCYTQHRPLVASSNHQTPILCMTCKQDSEKMWGCGWCHLRICTGCKDALVEVKNDLKKMLDEAQAGTLIIGKERIPMPPFLGENAWRSQSSDTSSVTSNRSAGSRPMQQRGPPPPRQGPYLRQERSMDNLPGYGGPRGPYGPPRQQQQYQQQRGPSPQRMQNQQSDYMGMQPMYNRPRQPMPMPGQSRSKPSTAPQSPNTSTPTFGPVSLGFQTNGRNSNTSDNSNNNNSNNNNSNSNNVNPYNNIPSNSIPYPHGQNPYQHQYQPQPQAQPQRPMDRRPPPPPPQTIGAPNHFRPVNGSRNAPTRPPRSDEDDFMPPMLDLSLDAGAGPMAAGLRGLKFGGPGQPMGRPMMMGNSQYQAQSRMRGMA